MVATDTQKNTIFAFASDGVGSPEAFLLRLADHFTGDFEWVTGGRWAAEQYTWSRINDHDHSFFRTNAETRTAVLVRDGDTDTMITGFHGLTVLKSTESGFEGYPKDKYTTLAETNDRILATDIATRWRYNTTDVDFNASYDAIKAIILDTFTQGYSAALQQTLFQMAEAVIWRLIPRSTRSSSPARTSTTSWSTSPLRTGEPERGVLRRRPPVRSDRGRPSSGADAGSRRRGLGRHRRLLLRFRDHGLICDRLRRARRPADEASGGRVAGVGDHSASAPSTFSPCTAASSRRL